MSETSAYCTYTAFVCLRARVHSADEPTEKSLFRYLFCYHHLLPGSCFCPRETLLTNPQSRRNRRFIEEREAPWDKEVEERRENGKQ